MLGAAVAAGASLISGIFGRSDAKKQARKEEKAIRAANEKAQQVADQMNKEVRARADAAALVPVQTQKENAYFTRSQGVVQSAGSVDMQSFMKAAEQNGFNPLTFLRSGALSLFAKTTTTSDERTSGYSADFTCTTGERAMDAALAGQHTPQLSPVIAQTRVPSMGSVFGDALVSGANQYLSDRAQQANNDFQKQLLGAQINGMNQNGRYVPRSGYVPQAFLSGSDTKRTEAVPGMFKQVRDNNPKSPTYGQTYWVPDMDNMPSPDLFVSPSLTRGKLDDPITVSTPQWWQKLTPPKRTGGVSPQLPAWTDQNDGWIYQSTPGN